MAQASSNPAGQTTSTGGTPRPLTPRPLTPAVDTNKNMISKVSSPGLKVKVIEKPQMSEINPGIWDGLSPDQARKYYPDDWERFSTDPYAFRAPRAESYHDLSGKLICIHSTTSLIVPLSVRLEPILIELEREKEDLLIIGHASVIRCLLAYLIGLPASEIPAIEIARGDLLEVVPASYGVRSQAFHFWDGPGRRGDGHSDLAGKDEHNFYENYAEDTKGKRKVIFEEPEITVVDAS